MKYNNPYSTVYPNYQLPQYTYTPNQSNSSIRWVQGEAAARAQYVDPGTSSIFLDSEDNLFYIKTTDTSGIPMPLRIFKYEEIKPDSDKRSAATDIDTSFFITKEEFEKRITELENLIAKKEESNGKFTL